jgi:hypothetical protein
MGNLMHWLGVLAVIVSIIIGVSVFQVDKEVTKNNWYKMLIGWFLIWGSIHLYIAWY